MLTTIAFVGFARTIDDAVAPRSDRNARSGRDAMEVARGTVAASGLVRHVGAIDHAVAQAIRQPGGAQLVVAARLRRARRAHVAVVGQLRTVEAVLELRRYPVPATRGEQPTAVLARQYHFVPVVLVVRFACRLQQLTDEIQRPLITFRVHQIPGAQNRYDRFS